MQISLLLEDVSVLQRIYTERTEIVDWMLKFGAPVEKILAEIIIKASEGKPGFWSLSPTNTWIPVK
jgi:hypothetical protein